MDILIVLLIIFGIYMIISAYTRRPQRYRDRQQGQQQGQQRAPVYKMGFKKKKKKPPTTTRDDAKKRLDSI